MGRFLRLILCLTICCNTATSFAQFQQKKIDSLTSIIKTHTQRDTVRARALMNLGFIYRSVKTNEAFPLLEEALSISNEQHNDLFKGQAYTEICGVYYQTAQYPQAVKNGEEAVRLLRPLPNSYKPLSKALYLLARGYFGLSDFLKAISLFQESYDLLKNHKYSDIEISDLVGLGSSWRNLGDLTKASHYFLTGAAVAERDNNFLMQGPAYSYLGTINTDLKDYKGALNYYLKALDAREKVNDKVGTGGTLYNIGNTYLLMKDYNNALKFMIRCVEFAKSTNILAIESLGQAGMAECYMALGDNLQAEKHAENGYQLSKTFKTNRSSVPAVTLAKVKTKLGKINEAENILAETLPLLSTPSYKRDLYEALSKLYTEKSDYKRSLENYQSFKTLSDSLINADTKKELITKEIQYDFDKKENSYKLKAALAAKDSAQQHALSLQQKQQLLLQTQKLTLSDREKTLQRIKFLSRQAVLENDRKLQAASLQKKILQAKLDKQVATAEIFKQNETIKTGNRYQLLLLGIAVFALLVAGLIFYNQYKTRRLNKVILTQKKDLEEINAVKDRMFGIVSHDMRSPVNTLIAFNALLDDDNLTPDKMKAYSTEIKKTLNHTSVLMENLLNWSSSQMQGYKPELESHSLKQISDDAIDSVSDRALQKGVILKNNIADDTQVFADKNMTELIMRNILSNAIKYTAANGVVELMADQHAGKTTFTITDTGMGMSADRVMRFNSDEHEHTRIVSQPGTEKEKGSGLGLVLCKTFTNMMNGAITATSEIGKGSTFKVTLPQLA